MPLEAVLPEHIASVVQRWTGISVEKMLEGEKVRLMKMENVLYAEQLGVIKKINFVEGDILSLDDKIIEFE
mgnify:CR=1 FL=1